SPSTATHHEPPPRSWSNARPTMPTRHRVHHHHHDQPTRHRIRHTGSTTTTPGSRSTNRNPWCGHSGPGSAGDKAQGFRGRGIGMEKRKEKLEKEAPWPDEDEMRNPVSEEGRQENGRFWLLGASRGAPPEGGPPRERRVPPAGAVAEVIREKGPTRVQSRCRRPPYPVPSNGPPSAPATDTAPRSKRKKAPPHH
ncbi:unnamed protein product, partial [Pleuronectes platessa]